MMIDNSKNRLLDVFFYGLYMDPDILKGKGVEPRNPRKACVTEFELRIGNKATLLRTPAGSVYGMVYSLTHSEIYALYQGAGLDEYAAEAIAVDIGGKSVPALCCNLIIPPGSHESNPEYEAKLKIVMERLGLPS